MLTANRGSCDLGYVDVLKASQSLVNAVGLENVTTMGGPLAARPAAIVTAPSLDQTIATCGAKPTGLAYPHRRAFGRAVFFARHP